MTMLEKVARAVKWRRLEETLSQDGVTKETMFINGVDLEDARAAIEAMREPTEEMVVATGLRRGAVIEPYRAMISAALKE